MASQRMNGKSEGEWQVRVYRYIASEPEPIQFLSTSALFFFFHNKLQYMHTHRCREQLGKTAQLVAGLSQLFTYFHSAVSE
jgi:hypothetical protein